MGSRTCAEGLALAFSLLRRELSAAEVQAMMSVRPTRDPRSVPEALRSFQLPTHMRKRRGRWRVAEL